MKYLRDFGWEPVVFTAKDAAYPVIDESLAKDIPEGVQVLKGDIWEPYELYKRFTRRDKKERVYSGFMTGTEKPSFTQKASVWLRGNFFIPDARTFWRRPSVKFLTAWLEKNQVNAIMSSGPPHTAHLIARDIKRKMNLPWLADFRDPWTDIDFYDQLMLTKWADKKHRLQEQSVLLEADQLTTVSWGCADGFIKLGCENAEIIFNGFDTDDFPESFGGEKDETFTLCHIGSLNKDRNSRLLWEACSELAEKNVDFKKHLRLRFIGATSEVTFRQLKELGMEVNTERISYLPHKDILKQLGQARVLLLLTNDTPNMLSIMPGKMYEYMAAQRSILGIGPTTGDAARVLRETRSGIMVDFQDKEGMKRAIWSLFQEYQNGGINYLGLPKEIQRFTRRGATEEFSKILNKITTY